MTKVARRAVLFAAVSSAVAVCRARGDLSADVDAALRDPAVARATVGVQVVRLGPTPGEAATVAPRVIYARAAAALLTPASNLKLLTTSAALDRFGPDFAFRTRLVAHDGDLVLVGDGDPALGDADLLARGGQDVDTTFAQWGQRLRAVGVRRVGHVLVDDTVFDPGELFHPHWPLDQRLKEYEAEVAGVNLNANCLDVAVRPTTAGHPVAVQCDPQTAYAPVDDLCVTGRGTVDLSRVADSNGVLIRGRADAPSAAWLSITLHDPPLYAATVLAESLAKAGVAVAGRDVQRDVAARAAVARGDPAYQVLAVNETPLAVVLARANTDSKNLYAECLCKRLGADANGGAGGTWANGTAVVAAFCRRAGVPADQFRLDDGCGLSKANAVTAGALTQVLTYDFASAHADAFMASLAVAGTDGTLANRFARTTLRGRVLAKTGHVDNVSCLSGYLHARDDQWYAFSILMNRCPGGGNAVQDRIVRAIDQSVPAAAGR